MSTDKRPSTGKKPVKDSTWLPQQIHPSMPRKPSGGKRGRGK